MSLLRREMMLSLALVIGISVIAAGARPSIGTAQVAAPILMPGFTATAFTSGTSAYLHPDSVEVDPYLKWVYVGYQNVTAKDGSDGKSSTVVEYTNTGAVRGTFSVPGHCDGLRVDPNTHQVWASSNEDGNPSLTVINPVNGGEKTYLFPPTPHGGGYDDMGFVNGKAYIAASNPNLNSAGVNVFPALDQVRLKGDGTVSLTPVLFGNASATDTTTGSTVALNLVDPDSITVDPQGDLVLDDQAGGELIFVHNIGTPQQTVTRTPVGTQVDDSGWISSASDRMLVADTGTNTVWQITGPFAPGTVFSEAPSDSGVASFVGTVDLSTGTISPWAMGFTSPTGLAVTSGS